jgi:ankyrin repeat protein
MSIYLIRLDYDSELQQAIAGKKFCKIKMLLALKPEIADRNRNYQGLSPIHLEAAEGNVDIIKILLDNGASVNIRDINGQTALHWAVLPPWDTGDKKGVITLLLRRGAEIDARRNDGNTPLHCVVMWGRIDTVKMLLKAGADPKVKNKKRIMPIELSKGNKDIEMLFKSLGNSK